MARCGFQMMIMCRPSVHGILKQSRIMEMWLWSIPISMLKLIKSRWQFQSGFPIIKASSRWILSSIRFKISLRNLWDWASLIMNSYWIVKTWSLHIQKKVRSARITTMKRIISGAWFWKMPRMLIMIFSSLIMTARNMLSIPRKSRMTGDAWLSKMQRKSLIRWKFFW